MGGKAKFVSDMARRTGHSVPERLKERPDIPVYLHLFYDAFFDLTNDRQLGFGPGPIPITAIYAYCKHHNIVGRQERDMVKFIRYMDNEYLKFAEKKSNGKA